VGVEVFEQQPTCRSPSNYHERQELSDFLHSSPALNKQVCAAQPRGALCTSGRP